MSKQQEEFDQQKEYLKDIYNRQKDDLKQQQKALNQHHIDTLLQRIDKFQILAFVGLNIRFYSTTLRNYMFIVSGHQHQSEEKVPIPAQKT